MTERRQRDNDLTPSSRRALIKRLTVGTAAAGVAFAYPVVLTFSQEWADAAGSQRVDHSMVSAHSISVQAMPIMDLQS
jgi:hypothetical protein